MHAVDFGEHIEELDEDEAGEGDGGDHVEGLVEQEEGDEDHDGGSLVEGDEHPVEESVEADFVATLGALVQDGILLGDSP